MVLIALSRCSATPPTLHDGKGPDGPTGHYASFATCTPTQGAATCPGSSCATNVVGSPDGETVALANCGTLDVVFTGGSVVTQGDGEDLIIYVGATPGGQTRVEASSDGVAFTIVGFLNQSPPNTPERCLIAILDGHARVELDRCNQLSQANFFRLSLADSVGGNVHIDAFEAVAFKERQ